MPKNAETYTCPVCGYPGLDSPPYRDGLAFWDICPSCGTEFGNNDANRTHEQLREAWIAKGMPWWSTSPRDPRPEGWDPAAQLTAAGF